MPPKTRGALAARAEVRRGQLRLTAEERERLHGPCADRCDDAASNFEYRMYAKNGAIGKKYGLPALPDHILQHLRWEFKRALDKKDDEYDVDAVRMCRGTIDEEYAHGMLKSAPFVGVGTFRTWRGAVERIVSVVFAFPSTYEHPAARDGAVCKPHQLYMDMVCAYKCPVACGTLTVQRFLRDAWEVFGRHAVIIHATTNMVSFWRNRWGFVVADTEYNPSVGKYQFAEIGKYVSYKYERSGAGAVSYRMARFVAPPEYVDLGNLPTTTGLDPRSRKRAAPPPKRTKSPAAKSPRASPRGRRRH